MLMQLQQSMIGGTTLWTIFLSITRGPCILPVIYNYSLEAIKGEEFLKIYSTNELLPPDIPKKVRGRPKKLRRREQWEGGNRSQAQSQPVEGPVIQRFSNRRVMHCALCREIGHNRSKCPTRHPQNDEESEIRRVEQGEQQNEEVPKTHDEAPKNQKPKTVKELRRQKIPIRRKGPRILLANYGNDISCSVFMSKLSLIVCY